MENEEKTTGLINRILSEELFKFVEENRSLIIGRAHKRIRELTPSIDAEQVVNVNTDERTK